jgi:hypothetical protein
MALLKRTQLTNAKWQFSPVKGNVYVVVVGDKIKYLSAKLLLSGIWGTSNWKTVHQAVVATVTRGRKRPPQEGRRQAFSTP